MILKPAIDEVLKEQGLLDEERLSRCLVLSQESQLPVEEVAVQQRFFTETDFHEALQRHFKVPYVDLAALRPDPNLLKLIPERVMRDYQAIAFKRFEDGIGVVMVSPLDLDAINFLSLLLGTRIYPHVTTEYLFDRFIAEFFTTELMHMIVHDLPAVEEAMEADERSRTEAAGTTVRLVDTILEQAVARRASDIHLEPQEQALLLRFRKDGLLQTVQTFPRRLQLALTSRLKIMAELDIAQKRMPQDGQFRVRIQGRELDMRVSTMPGKYGEKVVIRVLDKTSFALGLEQLGLTSRDHGLLQDAVKATSGMLLTTGPTGSGKTTTLYALLNRLRRPEINIMTFEDPVEYELLSGSTREGGITQVQINPRIGLTFAHAMRHALRQDPDVMMVGEIRDRETADIACQAALTGHFILTTLHSTDAATAVARMVELGVDPFLLSATLHIVVAQRLVRLLCPECKEAYTLPAAVRKRFVPMGIGDTDVLYHPIGCRACHLTGYQGRRGLYEVLQVDRPIKELVIARAAAGQIRDVARQSGVTGIKAQGLQMVFAGLTTVEEVIRIAPVDDV